RREVVGRADKETVIAVNVLGGVVSKTERRDQLLVSHPFLIDESIAPEARPEEATTTRSNCQRAVPVRIEVIDIASAQVHAGVAKFVLTVDLGIPDVMPARNHPASVPTRPVAEAIGQSQI